ncbi:hypothetical protein RCG17_23105 [Neobacillus sp. PS3-12]|uniref:hypothetical protein n=1 Tax=Neobacillus sp. PS3-12 TaxID=3070677 RepID=UPI0027E14690|nr:hypothetical protein [Neobacillus sp. PS3-12]WML52242.1 hypothetical protein RCG17_23105 [Neobacillus sp. PS3-12]
MKEVIISELGKLVGLKLQDAGRASNLFWLGFGDIIQIIRKGKTQESAEYALHIQCSWRITLNNKIVVASRDFYSPSSEWDGDIEKFDWDIQGNNRFDERIKTFTKDKERLKVKKIESDDVGGLKVFLSDGYKLEAFPDSSEDDEQSEHWRFFNRKDNSPHFVATGLGIEKV